MPKTLFRFLPLLLLAVSVSAQQIHVRMNTRLSSDSTAAGTPFEGVLIDPVQINGRECARGSRVGGVVTNSKASGRLSGPGVLELQPEWISCSRHRIEVSAMPVHLQGRSHTKRNVILIGGGAATGAVLGDIFGGGKGAIIGAAAGAGAGTAAAAATGRQEAVIEPESVIGWNLAGPSRPVQTAANNPPQVPDDKHFRHRGRHDEDEDYDDDGDRHDGNPRYQNVRFTERDRSYLRQCLASNYQLPPGLAKQGKIPPGHARKMEEQGYTVLPYACTANLSPIPNGYHRVIEDTRVVLLNAAQREVDSFFWEAEQSGE